MKKYGVFFLILIFFNYVLGNSITKSENELKTEERFFDSLRKMEFEEAKLMAMRMSGSRKEYAITLLNSIEGKKVEIPNLDKISNLTDALLHLSIGYANNIEGRENTVLVFQNFSKAISIADKLNQPNALKFSLISMLHLLRKQSFFGDEKYIPYLNHFEEIANDDHDFRLLLLFGIGLRSNENSEMKSEFQGFETIKKLEKLFASLNESAPLKSRYFFETGVQYKLIDDLEKSMELMRKAHYYSKNQVMNRDIYEASAWHISTLHYLNKNLDSAFYYWRKSSSLSNRLRNNWYNERLASWLFKDSGELDSAYFYLDKSIRTEIKLDGKQQRIQSSLLSIENETEKLKLDNLISENRRKANQNWLIVAAIVLLLGSGMAILLQKNTSKKRQLAEQEVLLKQQRVENLLKEQELFSIDAMIAGQEKERQKVAGELHDDLGSIMATIKLHFDNIKVNEKDPALQNAKRLLEEAYQKIRGMSHSKNSGVMSDQGLLSAIKKMANTISETNTMEVTVEDFGLGERLENSLELSVFRMVQELVANAIKHAEASKVNIQLTQHEDNLNIIVEDNGKGFDRSRLDKNKPGMGLTNIEKRVEHLEGNFTVDSIIGKGTSILIDIPV